MANPLEMSSEQIDEFVQLFSEHEFPPDTAVRFSQSMNVKSFSMFTVMMINQ